MERVWRYRPPWRVLCSMDRRVATSVLLHSSRLSAPFDTDERLRLGPELSPLLFSIFISDVIDESRGLWLGVRLGGRLLVGCYLLATSSSSRTRPTTYSKPCM